MAIEKSVSNYFYLRSTLVLTFSIAAYPAWFRRQLNCCPLVQPYRLTLMIYSYFVHRKTMKCCISVRCSAKFGRIFWRRRLYAFADPTPMDFMCLSLSPIDPSYVLKPEVSLYCISNTEAVFVETPAVVDLYSSVKHPFLYMSQFSESVNVIKMPLKSLHALAEKLGDPSVPVVWTTSTGRCGSTILCQMFENIPGTMALAEPDAPQNVIYLRKKKIITQSEYENLLRSTIRVLCKPHPGINRICIKPTPIGVGMMTDMIKLFPNIKHLFLYRNCRETVSSWLATILGSLPALRVTRMFVDNEMFSYVVPYFRQEMHSHTLYKFKDSPDIPMKNVNTVGIMTHMWANFMLIARDAMSRDRRILPIKFEILSSAPKETCRRIFDAVGIDRSHLDRAITAFDKDSQRGTVLSRDRLKAAQRRYISEADRIKADIILSSYNLPFMGHDFRL